MMQFDQNISIKKTTIRPAGVQDMSKAVDLFCSWAAALLLAANAAPIAAHAQAAEPFKPAMAFCERQSFFLEELDEVGPWLDYVSGLRTGRSPSPGSDCPSSTVRSILNIVNSGSLDAAKALRSAFHGFYVAGSLNPEVSERVSDTDGSFRYRNDVTLASFVWLLCPGDGEKRVSCVKDTVGEFPTKFVRTSPVFCDFATFDGAKVEWPPNRDVRPLVCAKSGSVGDADPEAWLKRAAPVLGD